MHARYIFFILLAFIAMSFSFTTKPITIYMIGDSTMSIKAPRAYPETGWGMPFAGFFDSTVIVANRAKNGRSTRTFVSENLWQPVFDNLNEGDYVFIQFGHNDESKEKTERYTTPDQYKENLTRFVKETRSKKAIPVLLTPVSRRRFDKEGNALETHAAYSPLVKGVAKALNVLFIDLDTKSKDLYQQMGMENSRLLFLQLKPGEHPNYPGGKDDNTHFNELGARLIAQIVLAEVKVIDPLLAGRIIKR